MNSSPFIAMGQDLRFALRQLRRSPGFAITAVLTLGLAIGATVTIAGIAQRTLLAPLPYPDPDRLVGVAFTFPQASPNNEQTGTAADFLKENSHSFSSMGLAEDSIGGANLWVGSGNGGHAVQVTSKRIDYRYLPTLGLQPELGRDFTIEEDRHGGPRAVLLSHSLWQSAFAANPAVIGSVVRINGDSYTVTGVMPPSLKDQGESGRGISAGVDVWLPLQLSPNDPGYAGDNYSMVARLKHGVNLQAAQQELDALKEPFYQQFPGYRGWTSHKLLHELRAWPLRDVEVSGVRPSLLALTGAVVAVLLIACLNLAGLMTARGLYRVRELAVRSSLGATRGRLLRLLLCESSLIAVGGAVLGTLLTHAMTPALLAASPLAMPVMGKNNTGIIIAITLVLAGMTALFGLVPAARILREGSAESLQSRQTGISRSGARLESTLVVMQIAMATVLLAASSLLLGSFLKLRSVDTGLKPQQLAIAQMTLKGDKYAKTLTTAQFVEQVIAQLSRYPGVKSVAAINGLPLDRGLNTGLGPAGKPEMNRIGELRLVTSEYFHTMGIPVVMGRDLKESDNANSAPVVLISAAAAQRWWPGHSPIGEQVNVGGKKEDRRTVVGVVADVRTHSLAESPQPVVYEPFTQATDGLTKVINGWFPTTFTVKLGADKDAAKMMEQAVASADPMIPVARIKTMQAVIDSTIKAPRFFSWMAGSFAGFALLLTAIGLFGLLSYQVSQRLREIGVRLAVGASREQVLRLFLGRGLVLTGTGLAVGTMASLALPRLIGNLLAGFIFLDRGGPSALLSSTVAALAMAAAGMVATALLASYLPAHRAAKTEPTLILRAE
jgi:predicted permease